MWGCQRRRSVRCLHWVLIIEIFKFRNTYVSVKHLYLSVCPSCHEPQDVVEGANERTWRETEYASAWPHTTNPFDAHAPHSFLISIRTCIMPTDAMFSRVVFALLILFANRQFEDLFLWASTALFSSVAGQKTCVYNSEIDESHLFDLHPHMERI